MATWTTARITHLGRLTTDILSKNLGSHSASTTTATAKTTSSKITTGIEVPRQCHPRNTHLSASDAGADFDRTGYTNAEKYAKGPGGRQFRRGAGDLAGAPLAVAYPPH
jgi:hypothetical protein